jgi:cell division protein FtsB
MSDIKEGIKAIDKIEARLWELTQENAKLKAEVRRLKGGK